MKKYIFFAAMMMALAAPAMAAKDPEFVVSKPVKDKPAITLDTQMGYVLVRTDMPMGIHLMRIASPEDQQVYDRLWNEAYTKARKKYEGALSDYQHLLKDYEWTKQRMGRAMGSKPVPPVEPERAKFKIQPFGLMAAVSVGPFARFAKGDKGQSVYLQSLTPGEYRLYGPVFASPGMAASGTCFCMGSVSFIVRPGIVTDLGRFAMGVRLQPYDAEMGRDPRLSDWKVQPAEYRAVGKLPNYYGVMVGRVNPIAGVVGYNRDQIIDRSAGVDALTSR